MSNAIVLKDHENELYLKLKIILDSIKKNLGDPKKIAEMTERSIQAAPISHMLHTSLKKRGFEPQYPKQFIENRKAYPDSLKFHDDFCTFEILLNWIENPTRFD